MSAEGDEPQGRDEATAPTVMATGPLTDDPPAPAAEVPERPRGSALGRYIVLERLGVGGMGVVYAAYDPELDRKVAIKLLQERGKGSVGPVRLLREAKAMARLSHPGVITVHDVGLVDGQVFIAMELVEGATLRRWLASERPWRAIVEVFIQAGEGLAAAHEAGLVHRDFKPDNVLVGDDGRVRVLDFGLAQATDEAEGEGSSGRLRRSSELASLPSSLSSSSLLRDAGLGELHDTESALTLDGAIVGTPAYMAPEHHLGATVDARSDIFAFAIALWEGLYRQHPFQAEGRLQMVYALTRGQLRPPPADRAVPKWLHAILVRGLRPSPDDRFQSMRELLGALRRGLGRRQQRRWLALAGGLVLLGAGAAWAGMRAPQASPCQGAEAQLAGIWDPEREAAIAAAFAASGVAYADATWAATREDLAAHADAWVTMRRDACEATQLRSEQSAELMDLRIACLNDQLLELGALTEVLAAADATVIGRARMAVAALPPLDRCADADALRSRTRPPADLAQRRLVDEVRARAATLRAHVNAGRIREAEALLPALLERAAAIEYPPVRAQVALLRGQLVDRGGEPREAEGALVDAVVEATAAREDELAAEAMIDLIYTVGVRGARSEEALRWARLAGATSARLRGRARDRLDARRLDREGLVLAQSGDLEEGLERQGAALTLAESSYGADSLEAAAIQLNYSATLADLGRLEAAQTNLEAAIRTLTRELGADHPHVAVAVNNLGALFDSLGAPEEALMQHERALAIKTRTLGPDHPSTANSHNNIAATLIHLGRLEEAAPHIDQALAIKEASYGADAPSLAETLGLKATVALGRGDVDGAAAASARALELAAGFGEAGNPVLLPLHRIAARVALAQGDRRAAEEHLVAALVVHREVGGETGHLVDVLLDYADMLWAEPGERARARAVVVDGLAEAERRRVSLGRRGDDLRGWLDAHPEVAP
ncbi:MAG: serine/threonine protein kinase [Myxococcales bacterium]|nr:serine/threonine protein kinase [Myxococcales bacterium]